MKKIIAFSAALLMLCGVAEARKVSGKVISGKEKLAGVIVTDGERFTTTGKNGKFAFDIKDDADFVYIVTPAGYVADWSGGVPAFYQKAEGNKKFVFDLLKTSRTQDYSILAMADPQTKSMEHFKQFAGKPMQDVCETAGKLEGVAVGLALGDICWDDLTLLDEYKKTIVRAGIPFYPVAGNHDNDVSQQGDLNGTAAYRAKMGPENYAFFLGKDVVIVVDNIIYENSRRYEEGYADHVLAWVKGLERLIPYSSELYIAQHSPLKTKDNVKIAGANNLLEIVRGHKVTFLSGHDHLNAVLHYESNIMEHNIASICGAWWDTSYCTEGSPAGYKVLSKSSGKLSWYYKTVGKDKDHQIELFKPGESVMHPNAVVLNIWDWDPSWKVEWFEDGRPMGKLKPVQDYSPSYIRQVNEAFTGRMIPIYNYPSLNNHSFAAVPSQYAKHVTISVENPFGKSWVYDVDMTDCVDVQAHRPADGNVAEAMKRALDMGINTLEFGLQLSKDGFVVAYAGDDAEMPKADELIDLIENYTKEKGYSPVRYNVEIMSKDARGEGKDWPTYDRLVTACCKLLHSKQLDDRLVVQSRDVRALNYMYEKYPEFAVSYVVDAKAPDFDTYMGYLKFTPQWLRPHHSMTDEALVKKCREKGMKIVPWAVDEQDDIRRILDLKVDAVISNHPDRVIRMTRGFVHAKPIPVK